MNDDINLLRGFALLRMDRQMDRQTDICECKVAFVTEHISIYELNVKFYCFDILNRIAELLMTIMFREVALMTMHLYLAFRILFKSINKVSHVLPTLIHNHEERYGKTIKIK